jgi:hypothetical protein
VVEARGLNPAFVDQLGNGGAGVFRKIGGDGDRGIQRADVQPKALDGRIHREFNPIALASPGIVP